MQISADDAKKLKPFQISGSEPAAQVVVAAHGLLGDEQLTAALPEAEHAEDDSDTRYNVFAVTKTRLIVVQGEGNGGWNWYRHQDMTSLTARTWRLSEIRSIEIEDFIFNRLHSEGTIYTRHRLVVDIEGEVKVTIPEFAFRDDDPHEPFQRAMLSAWGASPSSLPATRAEPDNGETL